MEIKQTKMLLSNLFKQRQSSNSRSSGHYSEHSLSAGNSPQRVPVSRTSMYSSGCETYTSYDSSNDALKCSVCNKTYIEPRVLDCLHTFCTTCLQSLVRDVSGTSWHSVFEVKETPKIKSSQKSRSTTDLTKNINDNNKCNNLKYNKFSGRNIHSIICPQCGYESQLPFGGISALPINSILQYRIIENQLSSHGNAVLCDLCSKDNQAESRCAVCLISMCKDCGNTHSKSLRTSSHPLIPLTVHSTIQQIRQHRTCDLHPRKKTDLYCNTCVQILCIDCAVLSHNGHSIQSTVKASQDREHRLTKEIDCAKETEVVISRLLRRLNLNAQLVEEWSNTLEEEVFHFCDEYIRAVSEHVSALKSETQAIREQARADIAKRRLEADHILNNSKRAVQFAEALLASDIEAEILPLYQITSRALERSVKESKQAESNADRSGGIRVKLARNLQIQTVDSDTLHPPLYGRLVAAEVDPEQCYILTHGFQNVKIYRRHNLTLQLVNVEGDAMCFGGEHVAGFYIYRDLNYKPVPLEVNDNRNGTYTLSFLPHLSGWIQIAVLVNNKTIKGSPFEVFAHTVKQHSGIYHCCSYCSSSGSKQAVCACGSVMGGGFKGCGHGHRDHPGSRHWSCCGSMDRESECTR